MTSHDNVEETITSLGIGEALVTVLSIRGVPTPLAVTRLLPPDSLMGAIPTDQFRAMIESGQLGAKYAAPVDRESAHEIITRQLEAARASAAAAAGVDGGLAATMTAAELKAAQKARATQLARVQREALKVQQQAEREAIKSAERQRIAEQRADAQAQREMLKDQQRMAREEQAARERAQGAMMRGTSGASRRRRSSQAADPTGVLIRSVFGTLFGK